MTQGLNTVVGGLILSFAACLPAGAERVRPCTDNFVDSIQFIAEPTPESIRRFANGNVELFLLDTVEPALLAWNILILHPPREADFGFRQCNIAGPFSGVDFDALQASYDPNRGLQFTVSVQSYDTETEGFVDRIASILVNQATGAVTLTSVLSSTTDVR